MRFDPSKIRAISIDLNGTLLSPQPSVGAIYAETLRGYGYLLDPEQIEDAFRRTFREVHATWLSDPDHRMDLAFWQEVVDGTAAEIQGWEAVSDDVFQALYQTFSDPARWKVREGTFEFLDALSEHKLKITFFSNTDERMHSVLQGTHLSEYANVLALSCDLGYEKPSPESYRCVAELLECKPIEILHIGDSLINDGKGPYKAGWQCA